MSVLRTLLLTGVLSWSSLVCVSQAANIYVNHSGSSTSPYDTEAKACTNVQTALDAAVSGDVVLIKADADYVMNGTDQQAATFYVDSDENITIKGYYLTVGDQDYGGAYYKDTSYGWVVIDGNNGEFHIFRMTLSNINIHNVKTINVNLVQHPIIYSSGFPKRGGLINNCWITGGKRAILTDKFSPTIVRDCKFTGNYHQTLSILRFDQTPNSAVVEDCWFEFGNTGEGIVTNYPSIDSYGTLDVRNCVFNLTTSDIITNVIAATSYTGGTIANNVIYAAPGTIVQKGIHIAATCKNYQIYNNIIVGCGTSINDLAGISFGGWNCFYDNDNDWTLRTGDIVADPQFISAANGDFRLKPSSPCLNAGKPTVHTGYTTMGAWQPQSGDDYWPNLDFLNGVDFKDFSILARDWGVADIDLPGDLNFDDVVDVNDLAKFCLYWLSDCYEQ